MIIGINNETASEYSDRASLRSRSCCAVALCFTRIMPAGIISAISKIFRVQKPAAARTDAATIADTDDLLIVGHLPFMEKLATYLVNGSMESPVLKFMNGGIVCLDRESERDHWYIKWTIVPRLV